MPARVHRDHTEVSGERARDRRPDRGAEAVRVVQQRERSAAAEIERGDLDAVLGQRDPAAFRVLQHGRRESGGAAGRPPPAARYPAAVRDSPAAHDDALRERIRANLAGFEREPARGPAPARGRGGAGARARATTAGPASCSRAGRSRLRAHGGQWALPGGRLDPGESPEGAALRELAEEVGLDAAPSSVLGRLDDYPTRSGFVITPVVVWGGAGLLEPNPQEVAAVYRVPLAELDRPDVPRLRAIPESDRPVISIPLLGTFIHAPTAAVLYQLREVAVWGRPTRVSQYEQPVFAWR